MPVFLQSVTLHLLFASENKKYPLRTMKKKTTDTSSYEDSNEKLKKIIDNKKNETSALKKILKSLDKNVEHKNKKDD
jgi:predicted RNase H-like nuclease (RuvC/YqgF family)